VLHLVRDGILAAKDRQGNFEKSLSSAAATKQETKSEATPSPPPATPPTQGVVRKGMV